MLASPSLRAILLGGSALAAAAPTFAQTPPPVAATVAGKRIYTAADFARFAPKTAYDMLVQVPSFTIRTADTANAASARRPKMS